LPTHLHTSLVLSLGGLALCLLCFVCLLSLGCWRRTARRHACALAELARREQVAEDVHDSLLQGMQGVLLSVQIVGERLPAGSPERIAIEHLLDQGDAALADGRQQLLALRRPPDPAEQEERC
jgi:signal transduction histidine kinase